MICSMDDSLRLILPHLSPRLASPGRLSPIRELARFLPPVHWGGFECRLGEKEAQIDFHQGFTADDDSPTILIEHITSRGLSSKSVWKNIGTFCSRWIKPSSLLNEHISKVGLEFDVLDKMDYPPVPSVFMAFKSPGSPKECSQQFPAVLDRALSLLHNKTVSNHLMTTLSLCVDACPEGTGIIHIGTMLSRHAEIARVNVIGLTPEQAKLYLARLGWEGSLKEFKTIYRRFSDFGEQMVLGVNIGAGIHPKIGLECFPGEKPVDNPRWAALFEDLVSSELCAPSKRDALLAWPGYIFPGVEAAPWPDNLLIASLLKTPQTFGMFYRNLSHIKINYQPGQPLEAKAYLGYSHIWSEMHGKARSEFIAKGNAANEG